MHSCTHHFQGCDSCVIRSPSVSATKAVVSPNYCAQQRSFPSVTGMLQSAARLLLSATIRLKWVHVFSRSNTLSFSMQPAATRRSSLAIQDQFTHSSEPPMTAMRPLWPLCMLAARGGTMLFTMATSAPPSLALLIRRIPTTPVKKKLCGALHSVAGVSIPCVATASCPWMVPKTQTGCQSGSGKLLTFLHRV